MVLLRILTLIVALLLAVGEIARWWGQPRFLPLALDELLVALAMVLAASFTNRFGAAPRAAAWARFCGLTLALLVPTLDHLLFGPPKASAGFYAAILAAMLFLGLAALLRTLSIARSEKRAGPI